MYNIKRAIFCWHIEKNMIFYYRIVFYKLIRLRKTYKYTKLILKTES